MSHLFRHLGREIGIQVLISRISYYKWMGQIFVLHRLVKENYFFSLSFDRSHTNLLYFRIFWGYCGNHCWFASVVAWVLFTVFSIFCIMLFGDCTHPQHQEITQFLDQCVILKRLCQDCWMLTMVKHIISPLKWNWTVVDTL